MYGMSRDEYWNGDPEAAKAYRKAEDLRRHQRNAEDWRLGIYVMNAVQTATVNALRKKGAAKAEYMPEPLPLSEKESALREIRSQTAMLSVKVAEKVLRQQLSTDKAQIDLVYRMLDEVTAPSKDKN